MAAPTVRSIEVADSPRAWASAGFSVVDGAVALGDVRLELTGEDAAGGHAGGGVVSWGLSGVGPGFWQLPAVRDAPAPWTIDGIPTHVVAEDRRTASHPNGVTGIDVIILRSPNPARTLEALASIGLHSRAENGPRTRKARKTAQYFIRPEGATCTIELIGPAEGEGDGAAELWGLTLVCEDIDATHAALPESTKAPWDAVQKGRRMTVLQGKPHGISVACALISPHVKDETPQADRDERYAARTRQQLEQLGKADRGGAAGQSDAKGSSSTPKL
jgi:hypothetical protein